MDRIKSDRTLSFTVITVVYIIAAIVGVICFNAVNGELWFKILFADVVATIVVFIFSVIFKNASVYDPYWSVQPPVIVTLIVLGRPLNAVRSMLLFSIWFWGIRLTGNWAYTFGNLNHQDWRYTMLSEKTGSFYPFINFTGIHMVPTLIVYGCLMPAVVAMTSEMHVNIGTVIFFLFSVGAVIMQGTADMQMHRYRKNRDGSFNRNGLWKYSRHPNYLGEICMWWGVAMTVICSAPHNWYLAAGALCNTLLFLFVSIPMADKRQSSKEGFAEYKEETRKLIPIRR